MAKQGGKEKPSMDFLLDDENPISHIPADKISQLMNKQGEKDAQKQVPESPISNRAPSNDIAEEIKPIQLSNNNAFARFSNSITPYTAEERKSRASAALYTKIDDKLTRMAQLLKVDKIVLLNNIVFDFSETHKDEILKLIKEETKKGF